MSSACPSPQSYHVAERMLLGPDVNCLDDIGPVSSWGGKIVVLCLDYFVKVIYCYNVKKVMFRDVEFDI